VGTSPCAGEIRDRSRMAAGKQLIVNKKF
jgi:hypothetical protein